MDCQRKSTLPKEKRDYSIVVAAEETGPLLKAKTASSYYLLR